MSRQWSRSELAQQLRAEIMGYLGAASEFNEGLAKKLKLSRTDTRCLELIGRLGPLTAGRLAEESGLTTGAVTFLLDRPAQAGPWDPPGAPAARAPGEGGAPPAAVPSTLARPEGAGMVTRRRDTEDRRRVWVEI